MPWLFGGCCSVEAMASRPIMPLTFRGLLLRRVREEHLGEANQLQPMTCRLIRRSLYLSSLRAINRSL